MGSEPGSLESQIGRLSETVTSSVCIAGVGRGWGWGMGIINVKGTIFITKAEVFQKVWSGGSAAGVNLVGMQILCRQY